MSIGFYSFGEGELDAAAVDIGGHWGINWAIAGDGGALFAYPGQRAFLFSNDKTGMLFHYKTKAGDRPCFE